MRSVLGRIALVAVPFFAAVAARPAGAVPAPRCGDGIVQTAIGEECDDPNHENPCCDAATCRFQAAGTSCDGDRACSVSLCNGHGACLNLAKDDGTACDDGDPCTVGDQCVFGSCKGGLPLDCDDQNVCTDDSCDSAAASSATACVHTPNQDPCDDGLFCNGADVCHDGACGHAGDPCAGGADCKRTCNEATNTCVDPAGTACNDDGNVCTDDVCNGTGTCTHPNNAAPCDDGRFCNGADVCQGGTCVHAGDPCSNGAPCDRTCNEAAKNCATPSGESCPDDGNICTDDVCDGAGSCTHPTNTATCDDGKFCNGADTCKDGVCQHAGDPCAGGAPCKQTCVEATGDCRDPAGTACPDDGNVCTDDTCNGQGACTHQNNTGPCDDGLFCDGADTCKDGVCLHAGDPCLNGSECDRSCNEGAKNCMNPAGAVCTDDGNPCTDDRCDGGGSCAHTENTATCDDGVFCNGADTCSGGVCQHAGDPCVTGLECNATCDEGSKTCHAPADTPCSDDADGCTLDVCDGTGTCGHPLAPTPSVTVSVADAVDTTDRFCVDVLLANCGIDVGLMQGTLRAPAAKFALEADSVTCGGLPQGFQCRANETPDGIKFVVVPPVTQPATCIPPGGHTAIVHLCLHDTDPICSGQGTVPIDVADLQASDCTGANANPAARAGAVTCRGLLGDCNADGDIDLDDLLAQVDVALQSGAPTAEQQARCDDDCDGDVDIFDMQDEIDAILGTAPPPLTCSLPDSSDGGGATDRTHVAVRQRASVVLSSKDAVRGVELTFTPKGGPVTVTGAKTTKRTQGFNVAFRQSDANAPVRVLVVSVTGKKIPKGAGRIVKLTLAKGKHQGRLKLMGMKVAR